MENSEILELLGKEEKKILSYLSRKLPYDAVADSYQDMALALLEYSPKIKFGEGILPLVRQMAKGIIAKFYEDPDNRHNNKFPIGSLGDHFDDLIIENDHNEVEMNEQRFWVRKIISHLKPLHAKVLSLKMKGFSHKEIAKLLGFSEGKTGGLMYRAKEEFKKLADKYKINPDHSPKLKRR